MMSENRRMSKFARCFLEQYPEEKEKKFSLAIILKIFETLKQVSKMVFFLSYHSLKEKYS